MPALPDSIACRIISNKSCSRVARRCFRECPQGLKRTEETSKPSCRRDGCMTIGDIISFFERSGSRPVYPARARGLSHMEPPGRWKIDQSTHWARYSNTHPRRNLSGTPAWLNISLPPKRRTMGNGACCGHPGCFSVWSFSCRQKKHARPKDGRREFGPSFVCLWTWGELIVFGVGEY